MYVEQASTEAMTARLAELEAQYQTFKQAGLSLDLTRGKPGAEQLDLSNAMDGILAGDYRAPDGTDTRNYGGLDGLPAVKALFAQQLDVLPEEILIGGNASLTLMYQVLEFSQFYGAKGADSAWSQQGVTKFLCPVPGYDRHFAVCEELGIEMIPVAMTDAGPDMDQVEALVASDASIRGIWCVPRFSNPTGIVYSDDVVRRLAALPQRAAPGFTIMWDNAYAIHDLESGAPALANLMELARQSGTAAAVCIFGSTSKITFAGSGLAFVAMEPERLARFRAHLGKVTIGPDKVNQLRHLRFFNDYDGLLAHMEKHAAILKPRFDAVLAQLDSALGESDMGRWTRPQGGYFISFDSRPGLAREIVSLADQVGVKLTPAGATFPYGNDPADSNIRLAPSFPSLSEINRIMEVFVVCVQLASIRQQLAQR